MAGNPHVISVGVDLVPTLRSHVTDADAIVADITDACLQRHGEAKIPKRAATAIQAVAKVLNIAWIEEALCSPPASFVRAARIAHAPSIAMPRIPRGRVGSPTFAKKSSARRNVISS
jgi:hypothetical protein